MLTVFAVPKGFVGPFDAIQRNAVASWQALGTRVLLLGQEEGVGAAAASMGRGATPPMSASDVAG